MLQRNFAGILNHYLSFTSLSTFCKTDNTRAKWLFVSQFVEKQTAFADWIEAIIIDLCANDTLAFYGSILLTTVYAVAQR